MVIEKHIWLDDKKDSNNRREIKTRNCYRIQYRECAKKAEIKLINIPDQTDRKKNCFADFRSDGKTNTKVD